MLDIQEQVLLAGMTTFGIGGPARYFCRAESSQQLTEALQWARARDLAYVVLGGGSNVLFPDEGVDALVIKLSGHKWSVRDTLLEADAGCALLDVIRNTALLNLGGWEKLAGIPGTLGGAVRGNAGAFGSEIRDFFVSATACNAQTYELRTFTPEDCHFSYRSSYFKEHPEWIITDVQVRLAQTESGKALLSIQETIQERERRHIQNVRAAGSYFMNPVVSDEVRILFEQEKATKSREGRVPAGWLIEKAGMKGARIGDAVASEQHPNYLKNDGQASAQDVKELARNIKKAVLEKFGVELTEEAVVY